MRSSHLLSSISYQIIYGSINFLLQDNLGFEKLYYLNLFFIFLVCTQYQIPIFTFFSTMKRRKNENSKEMKIFCRNLTQSFISHTKMKKTYFQMSPINIIPMMFRSKGYPIDCMEDQVIYLPNLADSLLRLNQFLQLLHQIHKNQEVCYII